MLEAKKYFEQAADIIPENTFYQNQAGIINWKLKNILKSIKYFELGFCSKSSIDIRNCMSKGTNKLFNFFGVNIIDRYKNKKGKYIEFVLMGNEKIYSKYHYQDIQNHRASLETAWQELAEYAKKIKDTESKVRVALNTFGESHEGVVRDHGYLGEYFVTMGEYKKALHYFELALSGAEKKYKKYDPRLEIIRINLNNTKKTMSGIF